MDPAHALDRGVRAHAALGQIEAVIGRLQAAGAGTLPFMSIADALADRFAEQRRFAGAHPDDRVGAGDVRKLELIDAGLRVLGPLGGRIVEGRHVLGAADLLESRVGVAYRLLLELGATLLGRHRVLGDRGVALADHAGAGEDRADLGHLLVAQAVNLLQLVKQLIVLLLERGLGGGDAGRQAGGNERCEQVATAHRWSPGR